MTSFGLNRDARLIALFLGIVLVPACSASTAPSTPSQSLAGRGAPFTRQAFPVRPAAGRARSDYSTKGSLVFEADLSTEAVNVYQTSQLSNDPAPIVSFKSASGCPDGLAMDKKGTLYVADECNGNDIEEFPKGKTTEKTAITGISDPSGLAIDSKGILYVSTYPASIEEFKPGGKSPFQTISGQGLTDPFGLALDKSDNLYIADFGAGEVFKAANGSTTLTSLGLQDLTEPIGVAIDEQTGDLWVTNGDGGNIRVYALGSTTPSQTITGEYPYAASAQNKSKPKGTVVTSDINADAVYAFQSGSYTPYATLTNGVGEPISLLITKP